MGDGEVFQLWLRVCDLSEDKELAFWKKLREEGNLHFGKKARKERNFFGKNVIIFQAK